MSSNSIPQSLKIVAYLFIITGLLSAFEIVQALFNNEVSINIGILCFFIGIGLLNLAPIARTWAIVYLVFGSILLFLFIVLLFTQPSSLKLLELDISLIPLYFVLPIWVIIAGLTYWQYQVLSSAKIKRLFNNQ